MGDEPEQPPPAPATAADAGDARVSALLDELAAALELKPAARRELAEFVAALGRPFAKLPLVSFYAARTRRGGTNYRVTFRVPGYRSRTERLGRMAKPAYRRAQRVSEILQQVKARLMKAEDAYRELYVDNTPVDKHVEAWGAALKSKGVVADYLASQLTRLRRCIDLAGYARLGDVRRGTLPALIEQLKAYEEPATKQRLTASTINYYLATLRQFVRWAVKTERLAQDPLLFEGGIKNDERGKRRDVLVEELAEIVATARSGTVPRMRMGGEDRAMLYLAAYATGFRRTELRLLQVEWLRLDAKPPGVLLPAGITGKHRKETVQPLPAWFAAELKAWVGDRRSGPVWPYMPLDVAGVWDRDREAARAAWVAAAPEGTAREERAKSDFLKRETADGEVVFHSHRHAYSTQVVMNMDLKSAQRLTRHATTEILAEVYAHSRASTAAEGVERSIKLPVRRDQPSAGESPG